MRRNTSVCRGHGCHALEWRGVAHGTPLQRATARGEADHNRNKHATVLGGGLLEHRLPCGVIKGTAAEALASGCAQGTRSPRGRSLWSQLSSTSPARGTSWGSRTGPRQACNGVPPGCSRARPSTSTQRGRARVPPQVRERVSVRRGHSCHALESFGVNHGALLQRATAPAEAALNCDEHTMTSRQDALVVSPAHHVSEATAAALLA